MPKKRRIYKTVHKTQQTKLRTYQNEPYHTQAAQAGPADGLTDPASNETPE